MKFVKYMLMQFWKLFARIHVEYSVEVAMEAKRLKWEVFAVFIKSVVRYLN